MLNGVGASIIKVNFIPNPLTVACLSNPEVRNQSDSPPIVWAGRL